MTVLGLLAAFVPGHADAQTARSAAAALAAVVVIGVLVEREVLVSRQSGSRRVLSERLKAVVVPLVALLGVLIALRLESYV